MQRIDRIKRINRLIKKTERKIRHDEIGIARGNSSRRILIILGGGFQTDYSPYKNIYTDPINFDVQNWNINTTIGYRMNLPTKGERTRSGREKSKGNVLGIFIKKGNTNLDSVNTTDFTEIEFGYILKEKLRISAGIGNRILTDDYKVANSEVLSKYYTATGTFTFHFGRLSTDVGVTYLFNDAFEPQEAKLNAHVGLRFYFLKKIYKEDKKNIK